MSDILLSPKDQSTFRPSFCDIQLSFTNLPLNAPCALTPPNPSLALVDVKSLAYNAAMDAGFFYGCADRPLARVGRVVKVTGHIEFGLETYQAIIQALSDMTSGGFGLGGFGDVAFDLSVLYQIRPDAGFVRDILRFCRVVGTEISAKSGGAPLSATLTLSIARIDSGVAVQAQNVSLTAGSNTTVSGGLTG